MAISECDRYYRDKALTSGRNTLTLPLQGKSSGFIICRYTKTDQFDFCVQESRVW